MCRAPPVWSTVLALVIGLSSESLRWLTGDAGELPLPPFLASKPLTIAVLLFGQQQRYTSGGGISSVVLSERDGKIDATREVHFDDYHGTTTHFARPTDEIPIQIAVVDPDLHYNFKMVL